MYSIYLKPPQPKPAPLETPKGVSLDLAGYERGFFPKHTLWPVIEDCDAEYMMWRALTYATKTREAAGQEANQTRAELLWDRAEKQRQVAEKVAGLVSFARSSELDQEISWITGAGGNLSLLLEDGPSGLEWRTPGPTVPKYVFEPVHTDLAAKNT